MRRTYKSKKDTACAIDRRDLFQNLDEKGTAYDAFSIKNIKQTKREFTCVGSSNPVGVASSRVRKKKFVKRIVKEAEISLRKNTSGSAYLTPDRSLRVNKPLDPFDLLLMSSPARPVEATVKDVESVSNKVNVFDQLLPQKVGKAYTKRNVNKAKNINYSSTDSSDSDKENSDDKVNITSPTSDIRAHRLVVEKVINTTPKTTDDSINNIVNNLSLINRLKYNADDTKLLNRHRLTKNILSPLSQRSPLCSTPFKAKYRGESIFKFSPITTASNYSLKNVSFNDNNKSNCSIVLPNDVKVDNRKATENKALSLSDNNSDMIQERNANSKRGIKRLTQLIDSPNTSEHAALNFSSNNSVVHVKDVDKKRETKRISEVVNRSKANEFSALSLSSNNSAIIIEKVDISPKVISNLFTDTKVILDDDESTIAPTELEPFLGLPNDAHLNPINNDVIEESNKITDRQISIEIDDLCSETKDFDLKFNSDVTMNVVDGGLQTSEVEPLLGFPCNANSILPEQEIYPNFHDVKSDTVDSVEKENSLSVNNESYGNVIDCISEIENEENDHSQEDVHSDVSENSTIHCSDEDKTSLYDTCASDQSSILETKVKKEPVVLLQRLNDSSFFKYYNKMKSEAIDSDIDSSIYSEADSFEDCPDSIKTSNSSNSECDDLLGNKTEYNNNRSDSNNDDDDNYSNEISYSESSTDNNLLADKTEYNNSRLDSNDEDDNNEAKCISFVTTRRRNEFTNNSMISMFNDTIDTTYSSSTDCDKTVLSACNREVETDIKTNLDNSDIATEQDKTLNENFDEDCENPDKSAFENESRISFLTTRSSNVTDRRSSRRGSYKSKFKTDSFGQVNLPGESITEESQLSCIDGKHAIVLQPGKKWERSLSIYRRITMMNDHFDKSILDDKSVEIKGRKYRQSVISTMEMQDFNGSLHNESISSRRSTFVSKPSRSTIRIVKDTNSSRLSLSNSTLFEDLKGFLNEECDDTIIEFSKLSITDPTHEITVLDNFHDTSNRIATAKDYVLRRCNQTESILFDECYPDSQLKNCHKIGEGVYGEVYLWRARDGRARVLKIVPIAGSLKVNGESQKDFNEIISEIVIAMELSALRAPIADIERHFDEGKDIETLDLHTIENATDVFNEVLAVRCVYGTYPSRLLDLWDLYDECKGSENDNPAILPVDQQYIVLELSNAGQDLESYQFNNAEQAHALFLQVAYGLAVAEEAFQFEHRDLHWGNVLISPTDQKYATYVIRGRPHRVGRGGVRASIIDYSLSRVCVRLGGDSAALYNDLAADESLFDAVGDYQFQVYRLMRDKLGNDWKTYEPYTNILWLHYTVDKMITALRYKRTNTKIHKHYIDKLKGIKARILDYGSAALYVLTDNEI